MKHLYFIRHGLSVMNMSGTFSGRSETPLHDEGRAQAKAAGERLRQITIDCIITSPIERSLQTAQIIADEIGYPLNRILQSELFTERDFGPLEGAVYQPNLGNAEGVEPIDELLARSQKGLAFLESLPHDNILLVSHGAIGRALRHCLHPEIAFRTSKSFENAEIVKLI